MPSRSSSARLRPRGWKSVLFAAALGAGSTAAAQDLTAGDQRLIESLRSFIPEAMREQGTPGLAIALARRGEVIWEEGFGYADLESGQRMTSQTVTRSGSMGKTYTATAVLQLVERGVLTLDEPVNRYFGDQLSVTNPLGEREITARDLLTHRSGLAVNAGGSELVAPLPLGEHLRRGYARKMFESYEGTLVPRWTAKVGEKFQYSNFGVATLGYLVEVTNPERLSFSDYVQKHLIDPLGMTSTQFPPVQDAEYVRPDLFARLSTGYAQLGAVHLPTPAIYIGDYPAGTAVTTPGDHIRLLLAYMNGGSYHGYRLLAPETVTQMLTPQAPAAAGSEGGSQIGLIWRLANVGKPDFNFGHGGAHMYGWTNTFAAYPDQGFAVAIFTNHWPMRHERYREHGLIADFISGWLAREQKHLEWQPPAASWAWKRSYVMGLTFVEQLQGGLGVATELEPDAIERMARSVAERSGAVGDTGGALFDPDGFRAGVADMRAVRMTPAGLREFLESPRMKVALEELELIDLELGGNGSPFPVAGY